MKVDSFIQGLPENCLGACLPIGRAELVDLSADRQARWTLK